MSVRGLTTFIICLAGKVQREIRKLTVTDKIVVLSTCSSREEADRIAYQLVDQHLAACVSVVAGVGSVYRWQGAVERAEEVLLIVKSSRALFDQLRARIEQLNSYSTPEVIALPIVDGAEGYLNWMTTELGLAGESE
jgi:periplasmic divalent cation tolerance protein